MEVLRGPSFTIGDRSAVLQPPAMAAPSPDSGVDATWSCFKSGFGSFDSGKGREEIDCRSDSSSSIGDPDDDSDENGEEVQSKSSGRFGSLESLEESLPVKRGLSNHFSGKSKSFANLAEANSVEVMEKPENPFNKKRRILIASKLMRKSPFYCLPNPKSMPLLALKEEHGGEEEEESQALFSSEDDEEEDEKVESKGKTVSGFHRRRFMSFKSRSCFSLADLQRRHEHEEQEDQ